MRQTVLMAVFVTCVFGGVAGGQGGAPDEGGLQQRDRGGILEMDRAREKACNCCQECQAAMKSTKGKEEGPPQTNACRGCCQRCGKKIPMDKSVPPEVVR